MARCSHPHYTLDLGTKENGKRNLKFVGFQPDLSSLAQLSARYGNKNIVPLPCGCCFQCSINHAKEWAVRCMLEALGHEENYFITLTYDNEHLPKDGSLKKKDLQDFWKRLRYYFGDFSYLAVGEYGKAGCRPHFHALVFGLHIDDIRLVLEHRKSKKFEAAWSFGAYSLDEVTYASCNYVAQYTTNKLFKGNDLPGKVKEFLVCSKKPAIGLNWCKENIAKILEYDAIYGFFGGSKEARVPRYFDRVAEALDKEAFDFMKRKRLDKNNSFELNEMLVHQFENAERLLEYQESITLNDFIRRKRGQRKL